MRDGRLVLMTAACFASYFLFGFVDNMKGATLPSILGETGLGYVAGGNIVLAEYGGFVLATLFTGILADVLGRRSVMFIAGIFLVAGIWGYSGAREMFAFVAAFSLVGVGCGALELGGGNIVSDIHGGNRGRYLNLLSCFHGVGSTLAPLYVAWLASAGYGWRVAYRGCLVAVAAFLLLFLFAKYPERRVAESGGIELRTLLRTVASGRMTLMFLLMFSYVATEICMATWLMDFLIGDKGLSFTAGSAFLSLFFACFMAGRFAGSFVVDRLGHLRVLVFCGMASAVMLAAGIFGPAWLAAALPLAGLFYAVIFPTATAVVSNAVAENRGTVLGLLYCCGGVGGMVGPWLTGMANASVGLKAGMAVNIGFCLVIFVCAVALRIIAPRERADANGL